MKNQTYLGLPLLIKWKFVNGLDRSALISLYPLYPSNYPLHLSLTIAGMMVFDGIIKIGGREEGERSNLFNLIWCSTAHNHFLMYAYFHL